jgi:DeoR/GlpR family transcriptional regulator of sugar metabolism
MTRLLRERSYLPIGELCRRFKISEATARRDLAALQRDRTIVRTFGGAMADYDRRFAPFAERLKLNAAAKAAIAARAAKLVEPGMTVFIDAGTTPFAVAELLRREPPRDLRVVTNSLAVAERLTGVRGIEADLLGGRLLPNQSVLLGPETCKAAGFYEVDVALLGGEAFDAAGVWNSSAEVVDLQRAVIDRSKRYAVLLDASKADHAAPARLATWDEIDLMITDRTPAVPGVPAEKVLLAE